MKKILLTIAVLSVIYVNFFSEKARLDREVNRLCAIDGGIKVYETVKLPKERFDESGNVNVPNKKNAKLTTDYYYEIKIHIFKQGNPGLEQVNIQMIRASDGKILGEFIQYARRGGDLPGPWHESSFSCPSLPTKLEPSIFLKEK